MKLDCSHGMLPLSPSFICRQHAYSQYFFIQKNACGSSAEAMSPGTRVRCTRMSTVYSRHTRVREFSKMLCQYSRQCPQFKIISSPWTRREPIMFSRSCPYAQFKKMSACKYTKKNHVRVRVPPDDFVLLKNDVSRTRSYSYLFNF